MRVVVLHAGGLGDLVLLESYLAAVRQNHPGASVELVCKRRAAPVATLFARPPDRVHAFDFDPYRWSLPDRAAALQAQQLLQRLPAGPVDLFVSAELRATPLSEVLAAALRPREAVIADGRLPSPSDVLILLGRLNVERNVAVRRIGFDAELHELDRYAALAGRTARGTPALRPLRTDERRSAPELAVFPCSSNHVNRWPLPVMGRTAARIAAAHGAAVVVFGSHREEPELRAAVEARHFGTGAQLVIGGPDDLPAIAERIAGALGYVGIDCGLVHLAAACGVPGTAVYGGGYGLAYAPWAPRSTGVVAPIPCFGCEWDCAFGRPFCLEGIDAESVVAAFETALAPNAASDSLRRLEPYSARESAIFEAAARVHRAAQHDRAARLTTITRLRHVFVRYVQRSRARNRHANALLASLAATAGRIARRLDEARPAARAKRADDTMQSKR